MSDTRGKATGVDAGAAARSRKQASVASEDETLPTETTSSSTATSPKPETTSDTTTTTPATPIRDFLSREKGSSPTGTITFILLRLFDVSLQYTLLRYGLAAHFVSFIPIKSTIVPYRLPPSASYLGLGLTPFHTIIFLLSVVAATRQIFWVLFLSEQKISPNTALTIGGFQSLLNTINTIFSVWSRASNAPRVGLVSQIKGISDFFGKPATFTPLPPTSTDFNWTFYIGLVLFVGGHLLETGSEIQRKLWKRQPQNKDKPYAGGLFKLATHINYGGFMLWRAGYAMCCAKISWGMLAGYGHGYQFYTQGIPAVDQYLEGKYGDAYKKIQKDTEWRLIPWIY